MIEIVVSPEPREPGKPSRRARFVARMECPARVLGTFSAPLCASARVLLAEGMAPDTPIQMRHAGSSTVALKSTIASRRDDRRRQWLAVSSRQTFLRPESASARGPVGVRPLVCDGDQVNHDILIGLVAKRVTDKRILKLIRHGGQVRHLAALSDGRLAASALFCL
jgi:hypothetical protein